MNVGDIVVGLDVGTTKIVCLIAEKDVGGNLSVIGIGESKSESLKRGSVVNIESAAKAIRQAVEQAEKMSGVAVKEVYVGIAGDHIVSQTSSGLVAISGPSKIINKDDVRRCVEAAKTISVPSDREILHVIPLEYSIDGQSGIPDPVGMTGTRLTSDVHIITVSKSPLQNLKHAISKANLLVKEFVLEPMASSQAVLTDDEKNLGVCLIDIGGGTTDIAMYYEGTLRYSAIVPLGGSNVTQDLTIMLKTTYENAEMIKTNYGIALNELIAEDMLVEVTGVGGRTNTKIGLKMVSQMIQPRMAEIFEFAYKIIERSGYQNLMVTGVVLTGGASTLRGTPELAVQCLGMSAKIGIASGVMGLADTIQEPKYSTAVGLIKYAQNRGATSPAKKSNDFAFFNSQKSTGNSNNSNSSEGGFLQKMKTFLDDLL